MKKYLILALLALSIMPIYAYEFDAYEFEVDGIYYNTSEGNAIVTYQKYQDTYPMYISYYSGSIVIPSTVTYSGMTYSVTSIGDHAFYKCSSLTSITIPNSVTSIGDGAFSGCSRPKSITIPNSVTSIGNGAFSGCTNLTSITLPDSVTSIRDATFYNCSRLTSITISSSVTSIGVEAFYGCTGLTSITIPCGVTSIGNSAFSGCTNLTAITLPDSVTSIGDYTFYNCSNLTSITLPDSVTSIGNGAFYGCISLTSITIPNSVTSIGEKAFCRCSSLTSAIIGSCLTSIGEKAFEGCGNLNTITLNNNSIVSKNRSSTNSLKTVFGEQVDKYVIGETVTGIGDYAFSSCNRLTSVVIGNSVTYIGNYAFSGCTGLIFITIPSGVTSIGDNTFYNCNGLTSITISNSVKRIGSRAFDGCTNLTSVHITDLAAWNNIDFYHQYSQPLNFAHHLYLNGEEIKGSLIIPDTWTNIGNYVFCGCSGLTSLTIPNNIKGVGEGAFYDCPKLKHIYVCSPIPADCDFNTFYCSNGVRDQYDVYNYAILHVPMGSKEEYAAAYEWRYFAKIKEDLDINGQVFYTTLSVNQAGDGYVKHYVKADEPYTLYIGSEEGMRINTVIFNGEDVTDKLIDGYYTTPNITRPSKIVVSFEQNPDGAASVPTDDNLHVYGSDGSLYVSGIEVPQSLSVYTLDGKLTCTQALEGDTKIKLNEGIYIIKVGARTFKVSL